MSVLTIENIYASMRSVPMLPRVVESPLATSLERDWSRCRSQARAKRRHAQGHKQHMREYLKPACYFIKSENTYYMHPELYRALQDKTSRTITDRIDNEIMKGFYGQY